MLLEYARLFQIIWLMTVVKDFLSSVEFLIKDLTPSIKTIDGKGVEALGFEPRSAGFHHEGSYPPRN